jgi:methionine biosynthesis protein MetW
MRRHYGIREAWLFLKDQWRALTEKEMDFLDVFDNYDEYWASGFRFEQYWALGLNIAKLIEDWFDPGSTVLDVGIGNGQISEYLIKSKKVKLTGLDISEVACQKANELGIKTIIRDINNVGLDLEQDQLYDYILLSEVLEHILFPKRILIEASHHTKKGIVVTMPNVAYMKWRIQLIRGYFPRQSFTHTHFWSIKDFELFCKALDIKILDFRAFLPEPLLIFKNLLAFQQAWLLAGKGAVSAGTATDQRHTSNPSM